MQTVIRLYRPANNSSHSQSNIYLYRHHYGSIPFKTYKWMNSQERKNLIEKANSLFSKNDRYYIKSGLDFLFVAENENKIPVRWKQYFVTWSAIYPLSLLIPFIVIPILSMLHIPDNRFIHSFFISGLIVLIMVYLLMPSYTRLIKKWLYK